MLALEKQFAFIPNPGVASRSIQRVLLQWLVKTTPTIHLPGSHNPDPDPQDDPTLKMRYTLDVFPSNLSPPTFRDMVTYQPAHIAVRKILMVVRDPIERLRALLSNFPDDSSDLVLSGVIYELEPRRSLPQSSFMDGVELAPMAETRVYHLDEINQQWADIKAWLLIAKSRELPHIGEPPPANYARTQLNPEALEAARAYYAEDYRLWPKYSA